MTAYPYRFEPIYKEKIWGGRSLERLFGRPLPPGANVGESWELADLAEGTSVVSNGPQAGRTLTEVTEQMGEAFSARQRPPANGRFPLLLKFLDANDILSLQVHPDADAVGEIGGDAALKTECWYVVESRGGFIYKGIQDGVTAQQFRRGVEADTLRDLVQRVEVAAGDFHYLPAGTVHALGPGVVVAEVQTPSDTTYRVTDWGRGRQIHVERSMQCIHFEAANAPPPGAAGDTLLVTDFFTVKRRTAAAGERVALPQGCCAALMILSGSDIAVAHRGDVEAGVGLSPGDTVLLPAALQAPSLTAGDVCCWLEITLPERR